MPKTVRALALAALFVLGGTATAHASTGTAATDGTSAAKGRTAVVAVAALPCMAC